MSLCLCHFPLGGVSRCLLYSSYTNWGQRMCRLSLDCCLPLCLCIILPPVPWHPLPHRHTLQTQPGAHFLSTSNTRQEQALTLGFGVNTPQITALLGSGFIIWVQQWQNLQLTLIHFVFCCLFWGHIIVSVSNDSQWAIIFLFVSGTGIADSLSVTPSFIWEEKLKCVFAPMWPHRCVWIIVSGQ